VSSFDEPALDLGGADDQDDTDPFAELEGAEAVRSDADDPLVDRPDDPALDAIQDGERDASGVEERDYRLPGPDDPLAVCVYCGAEHRTLSEHRLHDCEALADVVEVPEPTVHELGLRLLWDLGLDAYWSVLDALDAVAGESSSLGAVEADGEAWHVAAVETWSDGLLVPDASQRDEERLREASVELVGGPLVDAPDGHAWDDPERRRVSFTVRPAASGLRRASDGEPADIPPFPAGYRLAVDSANVDPDETLAAWRALLRALGCADVAAASTRQQAHEWSRAGQVAVYHRLDRETSEARLTSRGALFDRLADVASQAGGAGLHEWDDREVTGHREDLYLDSRTLSKLLDEPVPVGVQVHCYHPKLPRSEETDAADDPLRDPKVEVRWSPAKDSRRRDIDLGNDPVPVDAADRVDLDDVVAELDRLLACLLEWAGVPLADESVWTPDPYYSGRPRDRRLDLVASPLHDIRREERGLVEQVVESGRLSPTQKAIVARLLDAGETHVDELADAADASRSTVYRLAEEVDGILDVADGVVGFEDQVVRDRLAEVLDGFSSAEAWVRSEVDDASDRLDGVAEDSPLARWARRHGVSIQVDGSVETGSADATTGGRTGATGSAQAVTAAGRRQQSDMTVEFSGRHDVGEIRRLLRAGLDAADAAGLGPAFRGATFVWTTHSGGREERPHAAGVWHGVEDRPNPYGVTVGTTG
jgi:hypothetical protein